MMNQIFTLKVGNHETSIKKCLFRVPGRRQKNQVRNETLLFRGFVGDEILPSYVGIIS